MGKSFFGQKELEYLGYWISTEGIMPLPNKVSAIHQSEPPKNKNNREDSLESSTSTCTCGKEEQRN
eukprot:1854666-Ditylum_brightwellii.AAC.1